MNNEERDINHEPHRYDYEVTTSKREKSRETRSGPGRRGQRKSRDVGRRAGQASQEPDDVAELAALIRDLDAARNELALAIELDRLSEADRLNLALLDAAARDLLRKLPRPGALPVRA